MKAIQVSILFTLCLVILSMINCQLCFSQEVDCLEDKMPAGPHQHPGYGLHYHSPSIDNTRSVVAHPDASSKEFTKIPLVHIHPKSCTPPTVNTGTQPTVFTGTQPTDDIGTQPTVNTGTQPVGTVPPPTAGAVSTPTAGAVSTPTAEAGQTELPVANLEIVNVQERFSPRRLIVTLRNNESHFVSLDSWRLKIQHTDGSVSEVFCSKQLYITYQKSKGEKYADTDYVFTQKRLFPKVPEKSLDPIHLNYFSKGKPGYLPEDVVQLFFKDEVVDEWTASVPMSPMKRKKITTSWAGLKSF